MAKGIETTKACAAVFGSEEGPSRGSACRGGTFGTGRTPWGSFSHQAKPAQAARPAAHVRASASWRV